MIGTVGDLFNLSSFVLSGLVSFGSSIFDAVTLPFLDWLNTISNGLFDSFFDVLGNTLLGEFLNSFTLGGLFLGVGLSIIIFLVIYNFVLTILQL